MFFFCFFLVICQMSEPPHRPLHCRRRRSQAPEDANRDKHRIASTNQSHHSHITVTAQSQRWTGRRASDRKHQSAPDKHRHYQEEHLERNPSKNDICSNGGTAWGWKKKARTISPKHTKTPKSLFPEQTHRLRGENTRNKTPKIMPEYLGGVVQRLELHPGHQSGADDDPVAARGEREPVRAGR